ncbi:MAG: hypothetical protein KC466_03415 [Myxococcales bacterium]|nr:hypothetical protein [Myxococcales bacterium]
MSGPRGIAAAAWIVATLLPASSWGQGATSPETAAKAAATPGQVQSDVRQVEVEKKERTIRMGDVEIQGERERPKAMFILPKAFTTVEDRTSDRTFLDEIASPLNRRATESYSIVVRP